MTTQDIVVDRPWEAVAELVADKQAEALRAYITELPEGEAARMIAHLDDEQRQAVVELLGPEQSAWLLGSLPDAQTAEVVDDLEPETAAEILERFTSDDQADLLNAIDDDAAEAILEHMTPEAARGLRELAAYPADTAGGLMITEAVTFPDTYTVGDVVRTLRQNTTQYADMQVQYVFVTDTAKRLVGVLRMRDLLFQHDDRQIASIMIGSPLTVRDDESLDDLDALFDERAFLGVPVVDAENRLLGIVLRSAVEEAMADRANSDHLKTQGIVGGEELRSMPVRVRATRRLSWLSVNIVLNIMAATVIALYQDTLEQVIALAVFLPIISDMSGCSGNQAVAVTMRELTLNLIKPVDALWVWMKEASVGIINGLVLGSLIAVVSYFWKGNAWLGGVVGLALACNTVIAVSIGGVVPLLLKRMKMDPALAAGPILTTVTDMCGFFLTLSLASAALDKLT